jgi:hypothetical protein
MKQTINTACFILLVSLLSGCSSSEEKACEAARESRDSYFAQYENAGSLKLDLYDAIIALQNSKKIVWNNQDCFTPEEVLEAQNWLRIKPK